MPRNKSGGYYAVQNGRNTGVYDSWDACRDQVDGYSHAKFQRFDSASEADAFASGSSRSSYGSSSRSHSGGHAEVYTDGACLNNGYSGARGGIGVYWDDHSPHNVSERLEGGRQTNNSAEIRAADRAIGQAKDLGYSSVEVHTDSKFLHNSATQWMPKWEKNDYTLANGGPVKNREDFEQLHDTMQGIDVSWNHVRGHTGNHGNEAADRLANAGARKHRY